MPRFIDSLGQSSKLTLTAARFRLEGRLSHQAFEDQENGGEVARSRAETQTLQQIIGALTMEEMTIA